MQPDPNKASEVLLDAGAWADDASVKALLRLSQLRLLAYFTSNLRLEIFTDWPLFKQWLGAHLRGASRAGFSGFMVVLWASPGAKPMPARGHYHARPRHEALGVELPHPTRRPPDFLAHLRHHQRVLLVVKRIHHHLVHVQHPLFQFSR